MRIGNLLLVGIIMIGTAYADDATRKKTVTSQYYVDTAVETKQPVVGAESGNYVVTYPNSAGTDTEHNEAGEINKRHISTTLTVGNNGGDGINAAATDIPTVGAVNSGLSAKQQKLEGVSGKLVTYSETAGTVGQQAIYDSSTAYTGQGTNLVQAQHVNAAVANGFSELLRCNSWETGHTNDDDFCLTYIVNTNLAGEVYVPQTTGNQGGN